MLNHRATVSHLTRLIFSDMPNLKEAAEIIYNSTDWLTVKFDRARSKFNPQKYLNTMILSLSFEDKTEMYGISEKEVDCIKIELRKLKVEDLNE